MGVSITELLGLVAGALDRERIDFLLIGGMAMSVWVEPRLTKDCDIVVKVRKTDQARLKVGLVAAGARATSLEMRLLFERPFIRFKTTGGPILDVHRCLTAHDRSAFDHSVKLEKWGHTFRVATPEDLVLYKLQAWRPQDRIDIQSLLSQVRDLDRTYIESWLDRIRESTNEPMWDRWSDSLRGL
ncbi:MAG: nucleotidyl transferase AbiEii/AbiGii toxin family protein [Planctomycetota bacterium]